MSSASFNKTATALLIAVVGCSQPPGPPVEPVAPVEPLAPSKVEEPPDDGLPDGPAALRMRWYLNLINEDGASLSKAEYAGSFDPRFIAKVPLAQLNVGLAQLGAARPFAIDKVKDGATAHKLAVVITAKGGKLGVYMRVTKEAPHKIVGLLMKPELGEQTLASWEELGARLSEQGKYAQFLAAKLENFRCVEIAAHDAGRQLAIGSAFKLYVLLALHERIARKALAWDRELAIRDDHKSLPSGTMQNLAAGTKKSIKEFAVKMISISDNTATDHLLYLVGRKRVERALVAARHSQPAKNKPFMATREFFALKLNLDDAGRADYIKMSTAGKRRFLERKLDKSEPKAEKVAAWMGKPRDIDTIEWYANPRDLCNVMAALGKAGASQTGFELREVLGTNPGVGIDRKVWTWVGYKGGSEPGVMNLTWLLRHANGGWYFFALTVNDPDKTLDETMLPAIAQGALALFGREAAKPAAP